MDQNRERLWLEELAEKVRQGGLDRREFLKISTGAGMALAVAASLIGIEPAAASQLQLENPGFVLPKHNYLLDKESPFEVKNILIDKAQQAAKLNSVPYINAGRGNPNFLSTTPRHAFAELVHFAAETAGKLSPIADLGQRISPAGLADSLRTWLAQRADQPGVAFLTKAFERMVQITKMPADEVAFQLVDATNGDFYPDPSRILPFNEHVVNAYLNKILFRDQPPQGTFRLFATEGATAAMIYVFESLKMNRVLNEGDKVAIFTPIFSPYLEIPALATFDLQEIYIPAVEGQGWHVDQQQLRKVLQDKELKALFLINPSNPGAVSLSRKTVETVAECVKKDNPDLVIINDTVYANFVEEFHTLAELIPENTIGCYSFSKYHGVTGWRLGVISVHDQCVVDRIISRHSAEIKKELAQRYSIVSTKPNQIPFYQRLEMDSRDVALAHTGGLSGPQQVIMSLFSLFELLDERGDYNASLRGILSKRWHALFTALGAPERTGDDLTRYYAIIDILDLAKRRHGEDFAAWLKKQWPLGFLFRLAEDRGTVCLPGEGFAGPAWSLRVALANVEEKECETIGQNILAVLKEYQQAWQDAS